MSFNEKAMEYSAKHKKELPVYQTPKYLESKSKAMEIINSGKYGLTEADFWILMNTTKTEKMAYTGLIISHNGCLKINDCLESKFDPTCVTADKNGYKDSLVYSYCNREQGIYEIGEVSEDNCSNSYPYAMAFKRLFDRVVLKLSKLAYAGIYGEDEADEFAQRLNVSAEPESPESDGIQMVEQAFRCKDCGVILKPTELKTGEVWEPKDINDYSVRRFGRCLCPDCQKEALKAEKASETA